LKVLKIENAEDLRMRMKISLSRLAWVRGCVPFREILFHLIPIEGFACSPCVFVPPIRGWEGMEIEPPDESDR
jgi:hypothetical protein